MIDRSHDLPTAAQARELGISRGSVHYLPRPVVSAVVVETRTLNGVTEVATGLAG